MKVKERGGDVDGDAEAMVPGEGGARFPEAPVQTAPGHVLEHEDARVVLDGKRQEMHEVRIAKRREGFEFRDELLVAVAGPPDLEGDVFALDVCERVEV